MPAKLIASSGRHRLWEVATTGYLQVVDRAAADPRQPDEPRAGDGGVQAIERGFAAIYPSVTFPGTKAVPPTFAGAAPLPGSPGAVLEPDGILQDGVFGGTVQASRPAVVLLKASYDPRWTATVDGVKVKPVMMAPSLVGVDVSAGHHVIAFRYKSYDRYPYLFALGALALLALVALGRGWLPAGFLGASKAQKPEDRYES